MRSVTFRKVWTLLICKLPFSCLVLVHEIALEVGRFDMHFPGVHAILTLQEAAEACLVGLIGRHQPLCDPHKMLVTIMPNDIQLA